MRRILGIIATIAVLCVGAVAVFVYHQVTSLRVEQVSDDVHVIFDNLAGNVGVLRTDLGAVVVDSKVFRIQGARVRELAEKLGGGPTQAIFNTHWHVDHTHGNTGFASGARFVSTRRTRDYLVHFDTEYWEGDAAGALPNELLDGERELRIGGKTVRAIPVGPAHTGGDLVLLFVEDRVVHVGDVLFSRRYPSVDVAAGGSTRAWADALSRVLELEFDAVIPGHGPVTDREGVHGFQRFLQELWSEVEAAARAGKSLEETLEAVRLTQDAGYESRTIPFYATLDRDFAVRQVWAQVTGAARPVSVPSASRGADTTRLFADWRNQP
jgi:glyoxylase-like metal-dependent hydrolase (beta-lactamase superfamily II)